MSKKIFIGIGIILVLAVIGIAAYVLRPTAEASVPIEAVPLEVEESQTGAETESEADSGEQAGDAEAAGPGSMVIFAIIQEESEVRFTLDEVLRGSPTTVIGATNQVAGEIAVDFDNPANSQIGTILINARTLTTNNNFRNRAIKNEILDTQEYEFITFTPTTISSFPNNPQFGEELAFQIIGDLTIRDITQKVIFDAKVTADSDTHLSGYGSTMVARADYNLTIPSVQSVADVDEEVLLEIKFVATLQ